MSNEDELFPLFCQLAVEFGGVSFAWIGKAPLLAQFKPLAVVCSAFVNGLFAQSEVSTG